MIQKILKVVRRIAFVVLALLFLVIVVAFFYMKLPQFGTSPAGDRLTLMEKSSNFENRKFKNIHVTPELTEGYSAVEVTLEFLTNRNERLRPIDIIPSVKTDLLHLPIDQDVLVWFGHSSYFIQIDGKRILVDPVFSGNASPIPGTVTSFAGTDRYTVDDLPEIDYLFISHDHYDHVDYETVDQLKSKVRKVICGLGVGAHFEQWGYSSEQIMERNWNEQVDLDSGFIAYVTPARHFSGRGLSRNNTLWVSYVLLTPTLKIYMGGDSGYDTHFADIGKTFGPIDLAILDNGQYDKKWRYIHTLPDEVLRAAHDLKAKRLFPVHSSKFVLANHSWDEPLIKVTALNNSSANPIPLVTPIIGELVFLKDEKQEFKPWWVGVK
jgi:L-ascorbate metabolism protein UlaG (beta-lactamase superfamily)